MDAITMNLSAVDNYVTRDLESSTLMLNLTENDGKKDKGASDADYAFVWIYIAPFVLLIGIVGNALTLAVMYNRRHLGTSTTVYLSAMAIADILALLFRIPTEFFEACRLFVFSELNRWTCKLEKFSFYTASDVAIWTLAAFTIDRVIAVCFPLNKRSLCAPRRACLACLLIVVGAVFKNFHVFWTRGIETDPETGELVRVCGRPQPYRYFEDHIRPQLAFVLISVLPFIVIVVCNTIIIVTLVRAQRLRRMQTPGLVEPNPAGGDRAAQQRAVFTQTSLMCLAASLAFLICVSPSIILTMGRAQWAKAGGFTQTAYYCARAVNHLLACVNHAINFFLYCLAGQRFRKELVAVVRRKRLSVSTFEASTRRYYLEKAAQRSQTSTSYLAMQTVTLTIPTAIVEDADE